jgi:NAD(P)-dependent dehydrogenase (short-subunit alcohol dehydrogenase family)
MELKGAVAVVTGGASGIGESVPGRWRQGVKVVIGDMDLKTLDRVSSEIVAAGGQVASARCNVTNEEEVAALMDLAIEKFGALNIASPARGSSRTLMINTDRRPEGQRAMTTDHFRQVVDVYWSARSSPCARRPPHGEQRLQGPAGPHQLVNKAGQTGQLNYSSTKAASRCGRRSSSASSR